MNSSPPIHFRIEWADSQGNVTASWLAAHLILSLVLSLFWCLYIDMKAIRYSLLLPLAHLAIVVPLIYFEQARDWKFIPKMQAIEDASKVAAPHSQSVEPQIGWDPYDEYRPSISVKAIYTVELPAALLVSWCGHPPGRYFFSPPANETWCRLAGFVRLRNRIVILDFLLIATVCAQWWLVGWRLDRLRLQRRPTSMVLIPATVITIAGALMALLSRTTGILELIAALLGFLALLGWLALMLESATAAYKAAFHRFRTS